MRLMGVAEMPSAMKSICAVWITRRMLYSRSSLRFMSCPFLRKVAYSMPCFRAVCNRKCASCGNICALRGAAMCGMLTADREIPPPPERMSWPRRKSGSFFMAGKTGHKKRPDLIRGGPSPHRTSPRLCLFTLGRSHSINSKRAPCRSRVLLLSWLFCILCFAVRALQPEQIRHSRLSWPWPALRVPCCPRRRGQWQG